MRDRTTFAELPEGLRAYVRTLEAAIDRERAKLEPDVVAGVSHTRGMRGAWRHRVPLRDEVRAATGAAPHEAKPDGGRWGAHSFRRGFRYADEARRMTFAGDGSPFDELDDATRKRIVAMGRGFGKTDRALRTVIGFDPGGGPGSTVVVVGRGDGATFMYTLDEIDRAQAAGVKLPETLRDVTDRVAALRSSFEGIDRGTHPTCSSCSRLLPMFYPCGCSHFDVAAGKCNAHRHGLCHTCSPAPEDAPPCAP